MFRLFLLLTFFVVLVGGFGIYVSRLQYEKDTAHLQFIDPNNEQWNVAKEKAKATIDTFYALYDENQGDAFVKFPREGKVGLKEEIWAKVTAAGQGFVKVKLEPKFLLKKDDDPNLDLPVEQIVDWMVVLPTGKIRGGYTSQALLLQEIEQTETANQSPLLEQLELFMDKL